MLWIPQHHQWLLCLFILCYNMCGLNSLTVLYTKLQVCTLAINIHIYYSLHYVCTPCRWCTRWGRRWALGCSQYAATVGDTGWPACGRASTCPIGGAGYPPPGAIAWRSQPCSHPSPLGGCYKHQQRVGYTAVSQQRQCIGATGTRYTAYKFDKSAYD